MGTGAFNPSAILQGPILLIWINLNPSMDKQLAIIKCGMNYSAIPKR